MTDIEIAHQAKKQNIEDVAQTLGIPKENLVLYGNDKAKIKNYQGNKKGKLILVILKKKIQKSKNGIFGNVMKLFKNVAFLMKLHC